MWLGVDVVGETQVDTTRETAMPMPYAPADGQETRPWVFDQPLESLIMPQIRILAKGQFDRQVFRQCRSNRAPSPVQLRS